MSKTYCGACRGERGCNDCQAVGGSVRYTGLTEFYAGDTVQSEEDAGVPADDKAVLGHSELLLAADLGTTTLTFVCADERGTVLASYGCENPQRKVAADVIGRIDAALHGQEASLTDEIREALVKGFLFVLSRGVTADCGNEADLPRMSVRVAIAGNSVMQHLLLGYPMDTLAKAPFTPYKEEAVLCPFSALFGELQQYNSLPLLLRQADVTVFPCLSAFVGGDAVAGAYAVLDKKNKQKELLIDLGTNGELLLSVQGKRYGTAAAMGSAFEGGRYAYASELFRKIAAALNAGVMDETGLLCEPYFSEGYNGLLQEDVREFQLAKGALRAGIELLCASAGVKPSEVERIYLAGGLGRFCDRSDLFRTGLLPGTFAGKVVVVGNSCMGGLLAYLVSESTVPDGKADILNLAEQPEFEMLYYRFMDFEKEQSFMEENARKGWEE